MRNNCFDRLLKEDDVATATGLSLACIRKWRLLGKGPQYIKVGAAVRYKSEEVQAWLNSRPTGGEAITGPAL